MRRMGARERSANGSGSEGAKKGKLPYLRKDASDRKGQPKSATTIMLQTNRHGRGRMTSFEQAKEVLKRCFGHDRFRPEQERAIRSIMGKRDAGRHVHRGGQIADLPGARRCARRHQPSWYLPLVSLMSDQVRKLVELGLHPAFLNNMLSLRAQEKVRTASKRRVSDPVRCAGRLSNPAFLVGHRGSRNPPCRRRRAHCISEWGHDFAATTADQRVHRAVRPAPDRGRADGDGDPESQGHCRRSLGLQNPLEIVSSFDRDNLALRCAHAPRRARIVVRTGRAFEGSRVRHLLLRHDFRKPSGSTTLRRAGVPAALYHGKLGNDEKRAAQRGVHVGAGAGDGRDVGIRHGHRQARCTLRGLLRHAAFGRSYYQQIGRAGRDGKARRHDHAVGRAGPANRFVHGGSGRRRPKRPATFQAKLAFDMRDFCRDENTCRRDLILRYFGEKPLMTEGAEDATTARRPSTASCAPGHKGR